MASRHLKRFWLKVGAKKGWRIQFRQQASAEQLDTGPSIHLTLDRFEAINVAFHRSVAPLFGYCRFHRTDVLFQLSSEALQRMNSGLHSPFHPGMQCE